MKFSMTNAAHGGSLLDNTNVNGAYYGGKMATVTKNK
jgi:hypothetical protein